MPEIDTRFPWMAQQRWMQSDSVSRDLQTGYQLGQRNREMELREQYQAAQQRSLEAYHQTQMNSLVMRQQQMADEHEDSAKVTEWMQDPRQPPPSGLKTPKAMTAVAAVQKAYATTERGSQVMAVQKSYNDKIKGLDAMGTLRVQQLLDASDGTITPEIATLIDAEQARLQTTSADIQVLDEMGQPFVKGGETKPAFLRSTKTGALHRLPQDWTSDNPVIPLKDEEDNILGYGVRNASGGITQLREHKEPSVTMPPERRSAMNQKMKNVDTWWKDLPVKEREKPEKQKELARRIQEVQNEFATQPGPVTAPAPAANPRDPLGLFSQ